MVLKYQSFTQMAGIFFYQLYKTILVLNYDNLWIKIHLHTEYGECMML